MHFQELVGSHCNQQSMIARDHNFVGLKQRHLVLVCEHHSPTDVPRRYLFRLICCSALRTIASLHARINHATALHSIVHLPVFRHH